MSQFKVGDYAKLDKPGSIFNGSQVKIDGQHRSLETGTVVEPDEDGLIHFSLSMGCGYARPDELLPPLLDWPT